MRNRYRQLLLSGGFIAAMSLSHAAIAGPVRDFERDLSNAYAHYRAALLSSNQSNKAATEAAIAAFGDAWSKQIAVHKATPPPHYADDTKWGETLDKVTSVIAKSKTEAGAGDLPKAHATLEAIRDLIGDLRLRNGTISYSDRVNIYHEHMEHVVTRTYGADAEGIAKLREDVAVLAFLATDLERFKPAELATDDAFKQALVALKTSVDTLQAAARAGETAKFDPLRKALKPTYSRFFIKFG